MNDTIPARLVQRGRETPYAPAYYIRQSGQWRPTNWKDYAKETRQVGKALMALGVKPKGAVSILGFNRAEWVLFDLGAMSIGACAVGVYTTSSPEEVQYIVSHSESSIILVENSGQAAKVAEQRSKLPLLKHVVAMKDAGQLGEGVITWNDFLALAKKVSDTDFNDALEALELDGFATLIYTSGTTGPPKGVMLTHENLAWTASQLANTMANNPDDCVLSFLPLSHIAEQVVSIHGPITFGGAIYFAESIPKVLDNLKEVQPTILFAVPRVWEKFHAKVRDKLEAETGAKEKLIQWVQGVCTQVSDLKNSGHPLPLPLRLQYKMADKLLLQKLKSALGLRRARFCVSGAAPISEEILRFFASLDIIIHEVYGQSEDTGPTTLNTDGRTKLGTVGPPLPGVEVNIADDGEILVRGKNVSPGYYKDPKATTETFVNGWMHSGDLGKFDSDGYLHITGRKKDIIITAGGKNIAPKNIESGLKDHRLISEAVVIGDRRKYLTALITLDQEAAEDFLKAKGVKQSGELSDCPDIEEEIKRAFEKVNSTLAQVETIKKWTILPRNLSLDNGELTPTLKVKRKRVNQNFAGEIELMYS